MMNLSRIAVIITSSGSLISFAVTYVSCLLPAGRCWIGLSLNPTEIEFNGSAGGVSDHA